MGSYMEKEDEQKMSLALKLLQARSNLLSSNFQMHEDGEPLLAEKGEAKMLEKELQKVQDAFVVFLRAGEATPRMVASIAALTRRLDRLKARKLCKNKNFS